MADARTRHSREVTELTRQTFAGKIPVFKAVIRRDTLLREAPAAGISILQYAPDSETAHAYRAVAREILQINTHRAAAKEISHAR
jgi:chromosome partitioning protein